MAKELLNCIKSNNGKTYCYDCDLKQMVEIDIKPVDNSSLPEDVLKELIEKAARRGE